MTTSKTRETPIPLARDAGASHGDPLRFLLDLVRDYGDAVCFENPYGQVFFFNHPDQVQTILQSSNFERTPLVTLLLGQGLLASDGDWWRKQRRLAQPHFHEHCLLGFGSIITDAIESMLRRWDRAAETEAPLDVSLEMRRMTLEVIVKAMFSADLGGAIDELCAAITEIIEDLGSISGTYFNAPAYFNPSRNVRVQSSMQTIDRMTYGLIAERRVLQNKPRDLLSTLVMGRDESTGRPLNDREIRDEVVTILIGGHETTALTLTWACHLLAENPEVDRRLRAEVDRVLDGRTPDVGDLAELSFTRMVFEESMRLYPPVWFMMREAQNEAEIDGYPIPAKAVVLVSAYSTHRHKDFWDCPDEFDPDRFSPKRAKGRHRFAFFPFAGGRHHCLGHAFAMIEGQLVLAQLAQSFRWKPVSGQKTEPQPILTLRQRGGYQAIVQSRGCAV